MDLTIREHIRRLEALIQELSSQIMKEDNLKVRNALEAEIRAANLALKHYQAALEIEQGLARKHA